MVTPNEQGSPCVLLVDDDAQLARILGRALTRLGITIQIATDGDAALEQLRLHRFDALILDLRMPGMDGMDLLRKAAAQPGFPPTILHSAHLDVQTAVAAMRAGAAEVVEKPTNAADLAQRIKALTARKEPPAPETSQVFPTVTDPAEVPLILGSNPSIQRLRDAIVRVSRFRDLSVLIEGPTGTGKELVAQSIHRLSAPDRPMVSVNCAAIPADLFESELFGHESGAFTNARGAREGLFEEAMDGTLLLDEVGELPIGLQSKLLRVLETREFRRVGSNRVRRFNARLVSSTNRRLAEEASENFRSDLYFRLSGYTLRTPPLRDHASDVPTLAEHFARRFCQQHNSRPVHITESAMRVLCDYDWPGNVRQLRVVIEGAVVHAQGESIDASQIDNALQQLSGTAQPGRRTLRERPASRPLPDVERDLILGAYQDAGHNLSRAAETLGIPRTTLRDRLKRYGAR